MNKSWMAAAAALLLAGAAGAWHAYTPPDLDAPEPVPMEVLDKDGKLLGHHLAPSAQEIAGLSNAAQVMLGRRLLNETARLLPDNVGNGLNCNSCHMANGREPLRNHYLNTGGNYPRYMPRPGKEIDLAERINGCFVRSMNGRKLAVESAEMQGMLAYMHWLGRGMAKGAKVSGKTEGPIDMSLRPDPVRGEQIYAAQCASCHGNNGEGMKDASGDYLFPPLWGEESFNIGAGMARLSKAAAFVKHNMPLAVTYEPPFGQTVLPDQDAIDVAEYFIKQPRPDFAGKVNDWPRDNKPKDARY
ncbi:cytochrome C [Stenotrophomonas pictorum JCM 9942]|uniref:Cytochrome C n=1 Tax=Stenotrophomonas pictorum JCM 9942 TaxID=1236960 RepID=A0A0R0AKU8_9GAMM|nr:c-type cytochrome [Stenotrophomonas pictorum]KRG42238.1 cytochrome C [Stenotrophomonas pictorum JCM 9942]